MICTPPKLSDLAGVSTALNSGAAWCLTSPQATDPINRGVGGQTQIFRPTRQLSGVERMKACKRKDVMDIAASLSEATETVMYGSD